MRRTREIAVMCTDRVLSFFKMKSTHTLRNQEQIRLLTQFLQFIWFIKGTTTMPASCGVLHWRMHVIIAVPPVTTSLSWITCVSVILFKTTCWKSYEKNAVSLLHNLTKRNLSFTDIWKTFRLCIKFVLWRRAFFGVKCGHRIYQAETRWLSAEEKKF